LHEQGTQMPTCTVGFGWATTVFSALILLFSWVQLSVKAQLSGAVPS
jgi:hypothetical protein